MVEHPRRGDMYWVDFELTCGSEQGGRRPALVVQNDVGNRFAPLTIVVPLTRSTPKKNYPFMVRITGIGDIDESWVHCGHVRTIDKSRLAEGVLTQLDRATMHRVDDALRASLGLY